MAKLVANELLCYVQNNVTKHPRALMGLMDFILVMRFQLLRCVFTAFLLK
jgi:hypothetical protein